MRGLMDKDTSLMALSMEVLASINELRMVHLAAKK
jgi:hypothetical protein